MIQRLSYIVLVGVAFVFVACEGTAGGPHVAVGVIDDNNVTPSLESVTETTVQKLTYKIGPFDLPAGQKAVTMWDSPGSIAFQTDEPLWIVSFENDIEEGGGNALPMELLNLAILTNKNETNPLCTEKESPNPFIATTSSTPKIELPQGTGYPVLATDQLNARVILQNPTNQDFNDVYFKFTVTAVPMKSAKSFKDVMPLLLDIDPCEHSPMAVPPKEFLKQEGEFKIPESGILTKAYGLLQDFGVGVSLSVNGQPTPVWKAQAELSQTHQILSISPFDDPAGIPLKSGDSVKLGVAYDNPSNDWQSSATGAVMAYIVRTDDGEESPPVETPSKSISATEAIKLLID